MPKILLRSINSSSYGFRKTWRSHLMPSVESALYSIGSEFVWYEDRQKLYLNCTYGPPGGSAALPASTSWGPVRATARSRSTTCFARPAQTRRPRFVAMTYVVMPCMCYVSANMGDLCEVTFLVFLDKAFSLQLATGTRARGMGHYSG